jgi:purine-cytosine permease-like protein
MYTTTNRISKLRKTIILAPVIGLVGLVFLFTKDFTHVNTFQSVTDYAIPILWIVTAIVIYIQTSRQIKEMKGESFQVDEDSFILIRKDKKYKFDSENKPKHLKKTNKTIEIQPQDGQLIKINLENYLLGYSENKELSDKITQFSDKVIK